MNDPLRSVTAIVLSYRGREPLQVVLPSLAAQSRPAQEVIVVDDGSSDGTAPLPVT